MSAYSSDLYRYAYWLVGDKSFAEDLVQETFLRAWKAIHTLKDSKSAKTWLITILRRELARKYEKTQPIILDIDDVDEPLPGINLTDNMDTKLLLQKILNKLPTIYREPLILQVLAGYSCEEIANALNIQTGTIMTRVFRAHKNIKKLLEQKTELRNTDRLSS